MMRIWIGASSCALALLGAVFAVACGDDEPQAAQPGDGGSSSGSPDATTNTDDGSAPGAGASADRSGTRLKVQGVETGDGLFVPSADLFDSQMNVSCSYRQMTDGSIRCAPRTAAIVRGFSDDQCQNRVALVPKGTCPALRPQYADEATGKGIDTCDLRVSYSKLGQALTLAKTYERNTAGVCVETVFDSSKDYFAVQKMPDTDFVAGKIVDVAASASIAVSVFEGEDGSRIRRALTNVARNKPCQIAIASADGKPRCTPRTGTSLGLYRTDATCMTRLALGLGCSLPDDPDDDTAAVLFGQREKCGPLTKMQAFTRGARRSAMEYYTTNEADAGACDGPRTSGTLVTYDVGPEIPSASQPEVERAPPIATQRIAIETAYLSEGVKLLDSFLALRDTRDNVPCEFTKATDGTLRCLPTSISGNFFFSDPQCKVPLGLDADGCIVAPKHIAVFDEVTCTTKMYAAGPKLDRLTQPYYQKVESACLEVAGSSAVNLYTLGAEVTPDTFAPGTDVKR